MSLGDLVPREDPDQQRRYDASIFDEQRLRDYAHKVASELRKRRVSTRGPEPPKRVIETISSGFLGLGKREEERSEDRSTPRFWVVCVHRGNGGKRWRNGSTRNNPYATFGAMSGSAIVLLEDGSLCAAHWDWMTSPDRAKFTELRPADGSMLLGFDRVDRGRWHDERPNANELERERFEAWVGLGVHAKGMGVSLGLKHLLEGKTNGSTAALQ